MNLRIKRARSRWGRQETEKGTGIKDRREEEEKEGRERWREEGRGGQKKRGEGTEQKKGGQWRSLAQTVPQSESILSAPAPQGPKSLRGHFVQCTRHSKGSGYWVVYNRGSPEKQS